MSDCAEAVRLVADGDRLVHMSWTAVEIADCGELGRPGDNLYRLTFIAARPHKLLVEFDDQVFIVLTEPRLLASADHECRIGFEQMTLDWQGYGDLAPHASTWTGGQFTVASQ